MNQEIPLEIFEPPSDFKYINWIAAKDVNGLNAGVFFLRVTNWSLNLLTRTMTYKHEHPDEDFAFEEQTVLARLTESDEEFKGQSIYMPRTWFNAYFDRPHESKSGYFLAHFPGNSKWHMYEWLRVLESERDVDMKPVYNVPLQNTPYLKDIESFWNTRRRAEKAIKGFDNNVNRGADPVRFGLQHDETRALAEQFRAALRILKSAVYRDTDNPGVLDHKVQDAENVSRYKFECKFERKNEA
jgi:hypothetical protein